MLSRFIRSIYLHRHPLKRFIFIRRPILLELSGFKLYVRLDDWAIGARIAIRRNYEPHVTASMIPFLQRGTVVVDIGANIGYYTLLAASRIGDKGKVIAFAPSSGNCMLLQKSVQANGFDNVVLHPYAVADLDGWVGLSMDDSNGTINRDDPLACMYQVQAVTLNVL